MGKLVVRDAFMSRNLVLHVASTSVFGQVRVECAHRIDAEQLLLEQAESMLTVAEDHVVLGVAKENCCVHNCFSLKRQGGTNA